VVAAGQFRIPAPGRGPRLAVRFRLAPPQPAKPGNRRTAATGSSGPRPPIKKEKKTRVFPLAGLGPASARCGKFSLEEAGAATPGRQWICSGYGRLPPITPCATQNLPRRTNLLERISHRCKCAPVPLPEARDGATRWQFRAHTGHQGAHPPEQDLNKTTPSRAES